MIYGNIMILPTPLAAAILKHPSAGLLPFVQGRMLCSRLRAEELIYGAADKPQLPLLPLPQLLPLIR